MKHYTDLVYKQLKLTKRRNFLTIIGIVIGIMLFTAVGELGSFIQSVKIKEANIYEGNYEAAFFELTEEQFDLLKHNVKLKDYSIVAQDSFEQQKIGDIQKYVSISAYDEKALYDTFKQTIILEEGRYPVSPHEVILQNKSQNELHVQIGDMIKNEDKSYQIVGFYNKTWDESVNVIEGITIYEESNIYDARIAYIRVEPLFKKWEAIEEIAQAINVGKYLHPVDEQSLITNRYIMLNYELLSAYGQRIPYTFLQSDYIFYTTIFVNLIILTATITLTYSSLNASMKERVKQFGILRCIGATPKQIRIIILKESIILGVLGIIPGLMIGHFLAWFIVDIILIKMLNISFYNVQFQLDVGIMVQAVIFTVITIFIAAINPVRKSGQITPIEGIKNRSKRLNHKIKLRNSKIIKTMFGYKGQLAYKNIRANQFDFYISTITLTLSLIIFVGFTGYCVASLQSINMPQNLKAKDFEIGMDFDSMQLIEYNQNEPMELIDKSYAKMMELKEEIKQLGLADHVLLSMTVPLPMIIENFSIKSSLKEKYEFKKNNQSYVFVPMGYLYFYDDDTISSILDNIENTDITLEQFKANGAFLLNVYNLSSMNSPNEELKVNLYVPTVGQREVLTHSFSKAPLGNIVEMNNPFNFNLLGYLDMSDVSFNNRYDYLNKVSIMFSKDYFELYKEQLTNLLTDVYIEIEFDFIDRESSKEELVYLKEKISEIGGWFLDNDLEIREEKKYLSAISVLVYLILILTTTIGVINILNNKIVQTTLRKKEFGTMLAIGMEKEDLYKVLILEGVIQWLFASVIGGTISFIGLKILYTMFRSAGEIVSNHVPIWLIPLGMLLLFIVNLISIYYPLRRLKLMDTNEMIRDEE